MNSLGLVPEEIANLNFTPGVEVNLALPDGGKVRKSPQQKVVLSDHLPIAFTVQWVTRQRFFHGWELKPCPMVSNKA